MDERKEKVVALISKLIDRFYNTPDRFFVALAETLIDGKFSDDDIRQMVDETIYKVTKAQITVADVIQFANEKPKRTYIID